MKRIISLAATLLHFSVLAANAQIYADFTVSHGGNALGTFRARLDFDKAPRTCANFIGLATGKRPWIDVTTGELKANTPFYNGLTFHRLIHNFMIQGGSRNGQGTDGPGFVIQDEFDESLRHSGRYMLSMAKSSLPNTGGSQFFITLAAASHLDDKHSVFGEIISGKEIIDGFASSTTFPTDRSVAGAAANDPNYSDRPVSPVVMESVVVSGPDLATFDINAPSHLLPHARGTRLVPSRDSETSFSLTFAREPRHEYFISYSFNLSSWVSFRRILSLNADPQWPFTITGVTFDRFFCRGIDIDYSSLPNPPAELMPSGAGLVITDRSANSLTIVSNGSGGGTWTDSSGASGNIESLTTSDGAGSEPFTITNASNAHLVPLAQVTVTLDGPSVFNSRTSFDLILSFHTATSGWIDGTATGGSSAGSDAILTSFSYTP